MPSKRCWPLQQNRTVHDDVTGHFTPEHYLKSYQEMAELFEDIPEALGKQPAYCQPLQCRPPIRPLSAARLSAA